MSPTSLALLSALFFAGAFVVARRGMEGTPFVVMILITFGSAWVVVSLVMVLFDPPRVPPAGEIVRFGLIGVVAPGIGYAAALAGVRRLGPSISVPIQQGGRPLIAVLGAVLFLGESATALELVGMALIIGGCIGLSRRAPAGVVPTERSGLRSFLRPGIGFPMIAAVSFAAFDVLVRDGLQRMSDPTLGSMLTLGGGFLSWVLLVALVPSSRRPIRWTPGMGWIVLGGALFAGASLSIFHALERGRVVLVSPILATQPLMVFVLSRLLLRRYEVLTPATVVLGAVVVGGTVLVAQ